MNILLIAYSFPPLLDGQSIRWAYLTRELAALGHEIDVLTVACPDTYDDLLYLLSPRLRVLRVYPGIIEGTFLKAKSWVLGRETSARDKTKPHMRLLRSFYWMARNGCNRVLIPDLKTEWLLFSYSRLKDLIRSRPYELILSSHEPGVCHILGYLAKKWSGLHWIGDFGDPFIKFSNPRFRRPLDTKLESLLLRRMDGVILTNERLQARMVGKYPFLEDKKIVKITQGFDEHFPLTTREKSGIFTLSYFGNFYRDFRSPKVFAAALRRHPSFRLKFYLAGRNEAFLADFQGLGDRFEYKGLIPHREALARQRETDLLVNFGNLEDDMIPGKGFEYLGAGKPILQVSDVEDEFSRLIRSLKRGMVVRNDEKEITEAITYFYDLWERNQIEAVFDLSLNGVREYSWGRLAQKADSFFMSVRSVGKTGSVFRPRSS